MAIDNEINPILAEILASVEQARRAGLQVGVVERPGVVWLALAGCRMIGGEIVYDDAAAATMPPVGGHHAKATS